MDTLELNSQPTIQSLPARTADGWIQEINDALRTCTGWVVWVGRLLLRAKAQLAAGEWTSLFEAGKLKISLRTAEMLMAIARHPILEQPQTFASVPSGWSILYELSKLPPEVLVGLIRTAAVHPELTLREARALVQRCQANGEARRAKPPIRSFNLEKQKTRLSGYLLEQAARWPADQHLKLAELLENLAAQLRGRG